MLITVMCVITIPHHEGTTSNEIFSSIRLNREQAAGVFNDTLARILHFSPWKQFGVGFGVGW